MALSGTIKGSTNNQYISAKIKWSATQSVSGNYSNVTATLTYSRTNSGYTTQGTWSGGIIINGTETTASKHLTITEDSNTEAISATVKVNHNSDGTKSITISAYGGCGSGVSLQSTDISGTITLDTIPKSSSLSLSASSVDVGGTIKANISRASSSFTHDVEFYINSTYYKKYEKISGTSQSYTIPTSWYDAMPSDTNCTAYCRITTYNGSTKVGDQVKKSFTVNVPSSVVPTVGTIKLTPATINSKSILVKGKNKLTVNVSDCSAGKGSTINSYTFSGPSISKTVSSTSSSASTSVSSVTDVTSFTDEVATLEYKVTVTDKRGRSASKTKTIKCYNYYSPSFSKCNIYKANSDGSANINGSYIYCTYTEKYASVNSTNSTTVTAYYSDSTTTKTKPCSNGEVSIDISSNSNATYKVYLMIEDAYGGNGTSSTVTMFGDTRILNITKDGTGIAIGKIAESNNLFECRWPAKFHSDITFAEGAQCTLKADQNSSGVNIAYLMTGQNTSAGAEAGLAVHKTSVYVPSESNDGIVNLGSSGRKWNQLYAANSTISTSDKNKKKDIHDMSDTQELLFNQLKPSTYKLISGNSNRTHYGFIAQDVEDALTTLGLTGQDFAGFCKDVRIDDNGKKILDEDGNTVYDYALRYSEFIALNTYMIQKLQNEIAELKTEIKELKEAQN